MTTYPIVRSEEETMGRVVAGASLARYGDGEFALCNGLAIPCQAYSADLKDRLRGILKESGPCMVGIPNLHVESPKKGFWQKFAGASALLDPTRAYVSAFVTRPDSAPWIDRPTYWALVESLWVGRDVVLVRGTAGSFVASDLVGARAVREVIGPSRHAWVAYPTLLEQIGTPEIALLCLGPTATVMAVDLAARGVQAVDLGHLGMFWHKHLAGEPMIRTEADKVFH